MAKPDFSKRTIDTLAKRAGYICSNPDCRVRTVGPNTDAEKAVSIGVAAHIQGARLTSARFVDQMSDETRAAITNGIWLCGNCHTMIDRDEGQFPVELLYAWRELHDQFVADQLGTSSDRIRFELSNAALEPFAGFPPLIRRVVSDKPPGWEWRLTAELFRHLNTAEFRRLRDLRDGLYVMPVERVDDFELMHWIADRMHESSRLIGPLTNLVDRLRASWGEYGEPGDANEILHVSGLMHRAFSQIIDHEERVASAHLPEELGNLHQLMRDLLGSQIEKFLELPKSLDGAVTLLGTDHGGTDENPTVVELAIDFELPPGWSRKMDKEMKRAERYVARL